MTETVTREIVLGDGRHSPHSPQSILRLTWTAADPLAVVIVVAARPEHPSLLRGRWVLLRDRLRDVLIEGGAGDVPTAGCHVHLRCHGESVTLTLRAVPLPCVVTVPAAPLHAFLAETDAIVPVGLERCTVALDAEIARMLHRE